MPTKKKGETEQKTLRLATFNAENLFSRAKVLNLRSNEDTDALLGQIAELNGLLRKKTYTDAVKKQILALNEALKSYIVIQEDRGKLFKKAKAGLQVVAGGVGDWDGEIVYKRADFNETARENTAKVIKALKADVACVVEAEARSALDAFDSQMLGSRYPYSMLIDAFDPRGIDIGLVSTFEFGNVQTHMFEKEGKSRIFSRDCLEVEILMPGDQKLYFLCNHFKSQGYGAQKSNDAKRTRQAQRVAEILGGYNLNKDWVVVAGDFNDSPDRAPYTLKPLFSLKNLYNVLALQFPNDVAARWTYHYKKFEQIDFILVSEPLKQRFLRAGIERRGIYDLAKLTDGKEQSFDTVSNYADAASDHGAIWAEFSI